MPTGTAPFSWRRDDATGLIVPPTVQDHTVKKHDLYGEYVERYIKIVGEGAHRSRKLAVTIIEGFAGGGEFEGHQPGSIVPGSPLRLLEAVERGAERLRKRYAGYEVDARFWFNEQDAENAGYLQEVLKREGWLDKGNVRLTVGAFADQVPAMIAAVKEQQPRAGKALIIADQTGWKDATPEDLAPFLSELRGAELLVTISAGMLLNRGRGLQTAELAATRKWLHPEVMERLRTDLARVEENPRCEMARTTLAVTLRDTVQAMATRSGATLGTAFTLVPERSNQYLWVMHFLRATEEDYDKRVRALDAMTETQWSLNGVTLHYGGTPRHYLSYKGMLRQDNNDELPGMILEEGERQGLREIVGQKLQSELRSAMRAHIGNYPVYALLKASDNQTALTRHDRLVGLSSALKKERMAERVLVIGEGEHRARMLDGNRILRPNDILQEPAQGRLFLP